MSKIRQYNPTSNDGPHTRMEVSEPGPPAKACPMLWRIPKRKTHYLDTARSTRATTFVQGGPVFHAVRQGQAHFWRTACGKGRSLDHWRAGPYRVSVPLEFDQSIERNGYRRPPVN